MNKEGRRKEEGRKKEEGRNKEGRTNKQERTRKKERTTVPASKKTWNSILLLREYLESSGWQFLKVEVSQESLQTLKHLENLPIECL